MHLNNFYHENQIKVIIPFAHFSEDDDADNTLADPDEAENDYLSDDDGADFNDARPHPSYLPNDEKGNNISRGIDV